ncbi:MAG: hypothetical protein K2G88_04885, partial [Oscillospiraceae bacterium]|nr:hypothetical protein [Oscillospiraceae bacterium]
MINLKKFKENFQKFFEIVIKNHILKRVFRSVRAQLCTLRSFWGESARLQCVSVQIAGKDKMNKI